jgi:hypothetical protein
MVSWTDFLWGEVVSSLPFNEKAIPITRNSTESLLNKINSFSFEQNSCCKAEYHVISVQTTSSVIMGRWVDLSQQLNFWKILWYVLMNDPSCRKFQ